MWQKRAIKYAKNFHETNNSNILLSQLQQIHLSNYSSSNNKLDNIKQLDNEQIYPSKYGNFIYTPKTQPKSRLVCYYTSPNDSRRSPHNYAESLKSPLHLLPKNIDAHLCTHLNVGILEIENNRIVVTDNMKTVFEQVFELKRTNGMLKVLLWVGGADAGGFSDMVENHANRKEFIQSLKFLLETYRFDGVDIDWEFPSAYHRERQHFTQLLHEIRREYQREHRTYLLSVAVAAPEGIAFFAYDIAELNNYADFINIMTYDYHFYTKDTPFTGKLN